ncbi:MAG: HEAT repeat domain-containing protein [Planctomycetota bacterium]
MRDARQTTRTGPGTSRGGRRANPLAVLVLSAGAVAAGPLSGCRAFENVPAGATSLFAAFEGPTPQAAAELALDEYSPQNRFRGIRLLSASPFGGGDPYVRLYRDSMDDADPGVRWAATRAVGRHGEPSDIPAIAASLTDEDTRVRTAAALAMQRLHNPVAIPSLLRALDPEVEPDQAVRAEAAHALGQYAEPRVVEALIASLADRSLAVNETARQSLRTLTGQDFGYDQGLWAQWSGQVASETGGLFQGRTPYVYPAFERDRNLIEYLPFVPPPPNEPGSVPVGAAPVVGG